MRLLNTRTLTFCELTKESSMYAILSHTWGNQEVTYQEMLNRNEYVEKKSGFKKIKGFCNVAASRGYRYAWVDTCCIDKTNPSELSEAINSMCRWYGESSFCFVYLNDVHETRDPHSLKSLSFHRSKWFTRGWTLQELIAPARVDFYSSKWELIISKNACASLLSGITNIDESVLIDGKLSHYSTAQKMSWAANRETTKIEDLAYCLMGIFDVNMPLLYGEGGKAFLRLQEEIMKNSDDQSLFAWDATHHQSQMPPKWCSMFAPSPIFFDSRVERLNSLSKTNHFSYPRMPFSATNMGVRITLPIIRTRRSRETNAWPLEYPACDYAVLDCHFAGHLVCIPIEPVNRNETRYRRSMKMNMIPFQFEQKGNICNVREIYIHSSHLPIQPAIADDEEFQQGRWSNDNLERRNILQSVNVRSMSIMLLIISMFLDLPAMIQSLYSSRGLMLVILCNAPIDEVFKDKILMLIFGIPALCLEIFWSIFQWPDDPNPEINSQKWDDEPFPLPPVWSDALRLKRFDVHEPSKMLFQFVAQEIPNLVFPLLVGKHTKDLGLYTNDWTWF